jgi:hypothetical protein
LPHAQSRRIFDIGTIIDREIAEYCTREAQIEFIEVWDAERNTGTYSNPLAWWRAHETMYPNLAKLARQILAIPATSAPSVRLFSTAGLTISKENFKI